MNNSAFLEQIEEIQKDRKGVVESSVYPGIKELVSEIYPEEAHFIYELLQNAEDACADTVYFEIRNAPFVVSFTGEHIKGVYGRMSPGNVVRIIKKYVALIRADHPDLPE